MALHVVESSFVQQHHLKFYTRITRDKINGVLDDVLSANDDKSDMSKFDEMLSAIDNHLTKIPAPPGSSTAKAQQETPSRPNKSASPKAAPPKSRSRPASPKSEGKRRAAL